MPPVSGKQISKPATPDSVSEPPAAVSAAESERTEPVTPESAGSVPLPPEEPVRQAAAVPVTAAVQNPEPLPDNTVSYVQFNPGGFARDGAAAAAAVSSQESVLHAIGQLSDKGKYAKRNGPKTKYADPLDKILASGRALPEAGQKAPAQIMPADPEIPAEKSEFKLYDRVFEYIDAVNAETNRQIEADAKKQATANNPMDEVHSILSGMAHGNMPGAAPAENIPEEKPDIADAPFVLTAPEPEKSGAEQLMDLQALARAQQEQLEAIERSRENSRRADARDNAQVSPRPPAAPVPPLPDFDDYAPADTADDSEEGDEADEYEENVGEKVEFVSAAPDNGGAAQTVPQAAAAESAPYQPPVFEDGQPDFVTAAPQKPQEAPLKPAGAELYPPVDNAARQAQQAHKINPEKAAAQPPVRAARPAASGSDLPVDGNPQPAQPQKPRPSPAQSPAQSAFVPCDENDFLGTVAQYDLWYQTILASGITDNTYLGALIMSARQVDPNDPLHWLIIISPNFRLLINEPTFHHNLTTKFSFLNRAPVKLELQCYQGQGPNDFVPPGSPYMLSYQEYLKAVERWRQEHSRGSLAELLKHAGNSIETVSLTLMKKVPAK